MNNLKFEKTNDQKTLLTNAKKAVSLCQEINPGSGMLFFIPPDQDIKHMPSDARVEFIYMPTYTLAAYLILCKLHLKDLFTKDEELEQGFKGILLACTGRNMTGHGYEELEGLVDALEIFLSPSKGLSHPVRLRIPRIREMRPKRHPDALRHSRRRSPLPLGQIRRARQSCQTTHRHLGEPKRNRIKIVFHNVSLYMKPMLLTGKGPSPLGSRDRNY